MRPAQRVTERRSISVDTRDKPLEGAIQADDAGNLCAEIAGEVRDMAIALFIGRLSPPLFQKAVVTMESAKVQRFGFRLNSERMACGNSRLHLRDADSGRSCATFDFVSD